MTWEGPIYRTRIAHVIQARPNLLEIRYMPGVTLDMAGVREIHEVRKLIFGNRPYANISILPDDVSIDPVITQEDHFTSGRASDPLVAWAVVACGAIQEQIASLYFSKFPQTFPVLTTQDENEARAWADAQLDQYWKSTG